MGGSRRVGVLSRHWNVPLHSVTENDCGKSRGGDERGVENHKLPTKPPLARQDRRGEAKDGRRSEPQQVTPTPETNESADRADSAAEKNRKHFVHRQLLRIPLYEIILS